MKIIVKEIELLEFPESQPKDDNEQAQQEWYFKLIGWEWCRGEVLKILESKIEK